VRLTNREASEIEAMVEPGSVSHGHVDRDDANDDNAERPSLRPRPRPPRTAMTFAVRATRGQEGAALVEPFAQSRGPRQA